MELSNEDQLRLNVLLANPIDAVRIDESNLTVYALSGEEEAKVKLNPNRRADQYLRSVKELLSGHVLGSPGGYPVFLRRWTRMGQTRDVNLAQLLKLGEPEAVMAVAGATGLTDDLARLVWWIAPHSEFARCMLENSAIVQGKMGPILALHLVEHLPFESDPLIMIDTVRLVLQPGLIDDETRQRLWQKGQAKRAYLIGFMAATPDDLPQTSDTRSDFDTHQQALAALTEAGNPFAQMLAQTLSQGGQGFLAVAEKVLQKPTNQDDVVALLNIIKEYFARVNHFDDQCRDIEKIQRECEACCAQSEQQELAQVLQTVPLLRAEIMALLVLARSGEAVVTPILAKTTAIGSVMRKQLAPVTDPLLQHIAVLRGTHRA